jgi:hypothetical protein
MLQGSWFLGFVVIVRLLMIGSPSLGESSWLAREWFDSARMRITSKHLQI